MIDPDFRKFFSDLLGKAYPEMERLIAKNPEVPPHIVVVSHPSFFITSGMDREDIRPFLESCGYLSIWARVNNGPVIVVYSKSSDALDEFSAEGEFSVIEIGDEDSDEPSAMGTDEISDADEIEEFINHNDNLPAKPILH